MVKKCCVFNCNGNYNEANKRNYNKRLLWTKQNATDGLQQYPGTTYWKLMKQLHVRDIGQKIIQKHLFLENPDQLTHF